MKNVFKQILAFGLLVNAGLTTAFGMQVQQTSDFGVHEQQTSSNTPLDTIVRTRQALETLPQDIVGYLVDNTMDLYDTTNRLIALAETNRALSARLSKATIIALIRKHPKYIVEIKTALRSAVMEDNVKTIHVLMQSIPAKQRLQILTGGYGYIASALGNIQNDNTIVPLVRHLPRNEHYDYIKRSNILHRFSHSDNAKAVTTLRQYLADQRPDASNEQYLEALSQQHEYGRTPLHRAHSGEMIHALLDGLTPAQVKELIFKEDDNGSTVLHSLVNLEAADPAVTAIMESLSKDDQLVLLGKQNNTLNTVLHNNNIDAKTLNLLLHYAKPAMATLARIQGHHGHTILHVHAHKVEKDGQGNVNCPVKTILQAIENPETRKDLLLIQNYKHKTALQCLSATVFCEIVDLLPKGFVVAVLKNKPMLRGVQPLAVVTEVESAASKALRLRRRNNYLKMAGIFTTGVGLGVASLCYFEPKRSAYSSPSGNFLRTPSNIAKYTLHSIFFLALPTIIGAITTSVVEKTCKMPNFYMSIAEHPDMVNNSDADAA